MVDIVAVRTSKTFTRLFELRLLHLGKAVAVSEREIGSTLPACCPERHINPDGTFCTGLRAGEGICRDRAGVVDKLHAFALCQETAAETGFWPSEAQLSHGEAGEVELAAENAADQLGLRTVYREAVAFDIGLIASGVEARSTRRPEYCETGAARVSAGVLTGADLSCSDEIVIVAGSAVLSCSNIGGASWSTDTGIACAAT